MFRNRAEAAEQLARALVPYAGSDPVIYALPRGGVPMGAIIATRLKAPLDLIMVRKLGAPGQPELAIGAVVDGPAHRCVLDHHLIALLRVPDAYIDHATGDALREIERRRAVFMRGRPLVSPTDRTAIIVDDGLATGATMEAAVEAMRQAGAARIVVAVPVAPRDTVERFRNFTDIVCLETPDPFRSVGSHYWSFPQLTDTDVLAVLNQFDQSADSEAPSQPSSAASA